MNDQPERRRANPSTGELSSTASRSPATPRPRYVLTFFILFAVWVLFSGRFDSFHLTLGIIACALVSYFSADLLFAAPPSGRGVRTTLLFIFSYLPWLLYQIVLANLHVTYLVFHPRMHELIEPHIVRFQSRLRNEMALVTFANSITLTPGTITVSVSTDGHFRVHAIDKKLGEGFPGEMEERIAKVFGEDDA